jgi:alpha-1,2-mannosyltransferase
VATVRTPTEPGRDRLAGRARVAAALLALVGAATLAHVWYGNRHHFLDLRIYWESVRWWGAGHRLYDYAHSDPVQGPLGFTYPPFAALVLRPLGLLPFGAAAAVFTAVSVAAAALATYWLLAPVADRRGWSRLAALGFALPVVSWLEPVRETVTFGQINLLLAALVVGDLLLLTGPGRRGSRLAGVGVGLAAAIKLTPAIFIGYLLVTRRWRAAGTAIATAAAATLLAAAVSWPDSWRFWTRMIWDTERVGHTDRVPNQSLYGALARLSPSHEPERLWWLALALAVLAYGGWRARRAALAGDETAGLTLTALAGSLISPVTWSHHLFWFVPALVVLVDTALPAASDTAPPGVARRRFRGRFAVLAVVVWLTTTVSVISWYDWGLPRASVDHGPAGFLIDNWYVLLMLVLLVALPVRTGRQPARDRPAAASPHRGDLSRTA